MKRFRSWVMHIWSTSQCLCVLAFCTRPSHFFARPSDVWIRWHKAVAIFFLVLQDNSWRRSPLSFVQHFALHAQTGGHLDLEVQQRQVGAIWRLAVSSVHQPSVVPLLGPDVGALEAYPFSPRSTSPMLIMYTVSMLSQSTY